MTSEAVVLPAITGKTGGADDFQITYAVKDRSGDAYTIHFDQEPFGEGACKEAFHGTLVGTGLRNGESVVVKTMKSGAITNWKDWIPETDVTRKAEEMATDFNTLCKRAGLIEDELHFLQPLITKVIDYLNQFANTKCSIAIFNAF